MDRWERRLHLVARAASPYSPTVAASQIQHDGEHVIDARDPATSGDTDDPDDLIHPDEQDTIRVLLELAADRPGFRALVPLLARDGDRWQHRLFEVVNEVMGPVLRPVDPHGSGFDDVDPMAGLGGALDRSQVTAHLRDALARAGDQLVAVLLVDLDRFKLHNDLLGAAAGDELLAVIAERVMSTAGRSYAGPLGGDEFVVVLEHIDDPARAKALAERVRRAIADPVVVGGNEVSITATVGLAVADGRADPDHLLRDADTALFAGKDRGRDRVQVFGRRLEAQVARQLGTAQRLRDALAAGTLELHYQPVVSLETGAVVAAEALMRIAGVVDEEPISPAALIDAAEDSGLIARLGRYVLEETTSQIAVWESKLGRRSSFRVMVNVSPVQLTDRDFSNAIGHALGSARVSPDRLSLELTETVLLGTSATVDLVVQDLVKLGIAFGLDDFGADGSSLGGLRRFPIDFLKIDRRLVEAVDTDRKVEAIIASTVTMARKLGVSTVAVGVETDVQRDLLRALGCDAAQGYLFSPPLTSAELSALF